MSAVDPNGTQTYWFNGLPFAGVNIPANDTGTVKFWFNGLPVAFLYPTGGTTASGFGALLSDHRSRIINGGMILS